MTTTKAEELAAELEADGFSPKAHYGAAAELRRLSAVEAERDALLETFAKVCTRLDIDTEAARKQPGKPSDVLIGAIDAEQDALTVALECERMRVVACGVVACSDTPKSAAVARDMLPVYRSASCDDVARRVDECISLRAERDALKAELAQAYEAHAELEKEGDELLADAMRYRWLRDKSEPPHNFYISVPVEFHGVGYQPSEVDAYIDAARATGEQQ